MGEGKHWYIALAVFITQALTHGFAGSMGVFYVEWKRAFGEDLQGDGSSTIGWLTSSVLGVLLTTAPISGALAHHFGVRSVVMAGGTLSAAGLFASSFADTIHLLFFTVPLSGFGFGLAYASSVKCVTKYFHKHFALANNIMFCISFSGFGFGLAYASSVTCVTKYFHKHFALASGISSTGISCGVIFLPLIIQGLINYYTWRNAMMIVSGIAAQVIVCGALMKPPLHWPTKQEVEIIEMPADESISINHNVRDPHAYIRISSGNDRTIETVVVREGAQTQETGKSHCSVILDSLGLSLIWTNRVYASILPMFFLNGSVYATMMVYIKERAELVGITDYRAAMLISTIGIAGIFARAGHGRLIDKKIFHPTTLYAFSNILAAAALPVIAIAEHYAWFVICAACVGFAAGLYIALNIVIVRAVVGVQRFPGAIGIALFLVALCIMSSVPIAGLLLDYTGSYLAGFLYASLLQGSTGIWAIVAHIVWTRLEDPRWPPALPSSCRKATQEGTEAPQGA